ncbi:MAG TPA: PmoA family protein [Chryseosolibacter sp.]|nr:PmoA family protein [Chryseosolibacter sp.]
MNSRLFFFIVLILIVSCAAPPDQSEDQSSVITLRQNQQEGTISVFRTDSNKPLVVQNAKAGVRPYIHPIIAPDGKGELTEYSPAHHKHQTGLYWGLKQVNGRDYFMNWKEDYWRRISVDVVNQKGQKVKWRTIYRLLDEKGSEILEETQTWSFQERDGKYIMDLEWKGEAKFDLKIGKFYVGGLFVRMPWRPDMAGAVVNAVGQTNASAEGQRAIWNDIGIQVDGRDDPAHIVIFDHPDNKDFPIPWRVDNELGVGPSRQILGDWSLAQGETEVIRYRLIVYTGTLDPENVTDAWKEFVCNPDR